MSRTIRAILCAGLLSVFVPLHVWGVDSGAEGRKKIKAEWMKSAEKVARKINDPEVNKVFQFMQQNAVLAEPHNQGMKFLEQGESRDWFAVVPLLTEDQAVSDYWRYIFSVKSAAHFMPQNKALIIKSYFPYSSAGQALILFQQGYHAYAYLNAPYDWRDEKIFCYKERDAHIFQDKIMSLLGGKKYQEVLEREVARIDGLVRKKGLKAGEGYPGRAEYDQDLAIALGQPKSEMEKDFIETSVWIHAIFVFLDRNYKGDAENQKALFLLNLYKKRGIM